MAKRYIHTYTSGAFNAHREFRICKTGMIREKRERGRIFFFLDVGIHVGKKKNGDWEVMGMYVG